MILNDYMQRLIGILSKKINLLKQIFDLSNAQSLAIENEDIGKLESLVAEKQKKIDEVDRLDKEFDVFFLRLKSVLNIKSMDELKAGEIPGALKLLKTVEEVVAMVERISEVETRNNKNAKNLLLRLGEEIKKISQRKKANQAYAPGHVKPQAHFIDKKK